jgi:hypothetical protein
VVQVLHVLNPEFLTQLHTLPSVWLYVEFGGELQTGMDFHVDEEIVVKDDPPQMNQHNVGDLAQEIAFGHIALLMARVTEVIVNDLALVGALQCRGELILVLYLHTE